MVESTAIANDLNTLLGIAGKYLQPKDLEIIEKAYLLAEEAHRGQTRMSGDPYIQHPLATAITLAQLRLDSVALAASLLHDVPEDTNRPLAMVEEQFGPEVAKLVDGVTKLSRMSWMRVELGSDGSGKEKRREEDQAYWAENVRKMFLAMADDIRVVLIKLADRLHNMSTLQYLPEEKRRRIAQETMDIYAPLANRLGIWQIKWQLEDLAFHHLNPEKYKEIATSLKSRRAVRERYIARVVGILHEELKLVGIEADISGRPKHIYSIYRKMERRSTDISHIYDLQAVRIIVPEVRDCYTVLGTVHSLWHPLPGQFDDYIASPKESMYQSLHTTVLCLETKPLEIQIRTWEMHQLAEYGVAAHWRYKEGRKQDARFDAKVAWLRQLMDWQQDLMSGAQEFVDSLRTDVFQDQVYVFTPKGQIKELPAGATPLDFAYRIHTDIGHRCIGAKVNGRLMALDYQLRNGEIVEIMTSKATRGPSRDWLNPNLNYIKTAHARDKIRQWFKRQQRDENIARGREMLEKELKRLGLDQTKLDDIASAFKYDKLDDFLAAVGYGDINTHQVAQRLAPPPEEEPIPTVAAPPVVDTRGIQVQGVGDLLTRLARCCNPVPGDSIVGFITRGKGVTVHRSDCSSVLNEDEPERLVSVEWGRTGQQTFPVMVRVEAWDREGMVRDVAAVVADEKVNITSANVTVHKDRTTTIAATLEVTSIQRLARVLAKIEGIKDVFSVTRDGGGQAKGS
ncbi:MAG TPA: bifunctional (p)ppGpp synthetase/guanosine-3',5'-bis(diphosphate) 3'-pyrophosphohydrolase [Chloroflexota bacterium]|nr:bifunctional (p)ppGpp synthetase/guanosine-3',5'-bis(diphosphate) 3'-pyrophosphohydrolase [Chloroflexota bacterium]